MSQLSRLSETNIEDDILRAQLYAEIMAYVKNPDADLTEYVIKPDEEYRPDLTSYRVFGMTDLAWIVCLLLDVDDAIDPLPVGEVVNLPSANWIRSTMRTFMDELGLQ